MASDSHFKIIVAPGVYVRAGAGPRCFGLEQVVFCHCDVLHLETSREVARLGSGNSGFARCC